MQKFKTTLIMKNLMKLMAVLVFTVTILTAANAQTPKFGHCDLQALVQLMPERAAAETEFNAFQGELEEILGEMQKDYQTKLGEFEALGTDASEIKKNAKISEIQDIQQRIQNYQQTAQKYNLKYINIIFIVILNYHLYKNTKNKISKLKIIK